jgi:molybdate transport system ATP-binding protein
MQGKIAELKHVSVKLGGVPVLDNINLTIHQGEQWAIIGASGSGKTTLAQALCGQIFYRGDIEYTLPAPGRIILATQQHRFKNLSNVSDFYYQQRFNASDATDALTAREVLGTYDHASDWQRQLLLLLHLDHFLEKPLIQLSNGENKRLQLASALLENPSLLILDNPFIGLDIEGRKTLHSIINSITAHGIHIIIITTGHELPTCITHVARLDSGRLVARTKKGDYKEEATSSYDTSFDADILRTLQLPHDEVDFLHAVNMQHVTIRYGDKLVLNDISWEVKKGECWSLSGPNGAGKSTLLSLITADNPQAYANNIWLFDRKRGSGESIWEIKSHIGFISPELHLYFEQSMNCSDIIASGLFDTMGLFRRLSEEQEEQVYTWLRLLKIESLRSKTLGQVSTGNQRMVLLARALIKNPPLLILDEPCQGLDDEQSAYFKHFVNLVCETAGTTLIYVSHYDKDVPECMTHFFRIANGKRQF